MTYSSLFIANQMSYAISYVLQGGSISLRGTDFCSTPGNGKLREICLMRYLDDPEYRSIAQALRIPMGTVFSPKSFGLIT